MTNDEMYEKSFQRPKCFFFLTAQEQWDIDKELGILDWDGQGLTDEQKVRYAEYYHHTKEEVEHNPELAKAIP